MDLKILQITIESAIKGDDSAYEAILSYYWDSVYEYVLKMLISQDNTEDVVILSFTKAFKKLSDYDKSFDFKKWLITIAHHTAIDFLRSDNRRREMVASKVEEHTLKWREAMRDNSPSPEDILIEKQGKQQLRKIIRDLRPKFRKIIELRFIEERTYNEIKKETGLSMSDVKITIMRAKKVLINEVTKSQDL